MTLVIVAGLGLVVWGLKTASSARRPLDLVGSLAAGVGVICALAGAVAVVSPRFFGGH